jgi:putative ABC transport system permease protein
MRLTLMCLRNLFRRRLRTLLSIIGISLAIMSLVAISATTTRYVTVVKEMNLFFGDDMVVVAKGAPTIYAFPIGAFIQESTVSKVKSIEGVRTAIPLLFILDFGLEATIHPIPLEVVIGMPGNWSVLVGPTPLLPNGRWPSTNSTSRDVVVGFSFAEEQGLTTGSRLSIESYVLDVVGVLETQSALLSRTILMPLQLAQKIYGYSMMISMIVVKPQEGVTAEELAGRIETDITSVKALTKDERNEIVAPLLQDVENWILAITGILFFVSATIVTTVSMMNISERRRDFATLDALGAPKSFVIRMVITEAGLIGLLGSVAGMIMGAVAAVLVASFYSSIPVYIVFPDLFMIVPPLFMFEIIALTVVVSCVACLIPAMLATRTRVGTLRSEY